MYDAVDIILSMPNADGGFASYEIIRGPQFLDLLNPAEVSLPLFAHGGTVR